VRALIFDLDGTLVDTVYAHVFAWHERSLRWECRSRAGGSIAASA
jgi:phosphoglycolate phosphatase-like HAD superfamily hydrolase